MGLRFKDILTTASTMAADDYVPLDGATNGSRKLSLAALMGSPGPIGGTTAAAGSFTTLTAASGVGGVTSLGSGMGVRVIADTTNASAILQFTNNAIAAQWASLVASNGLLTSSTSFAVTGALSATGGITAAALTLSPFVIFAASSSALRFSGNQATTTLQGYDGTNAYGITLYNGVTPGVTLQSNGVSTFANGVAVGGAFGANGNTPQGKYASGGTLAGVVAALIANGILSS